MNKTSILILGLIATFCLGFAFKTIIVKQDHPNTTKMKKVTGIGGIFFKCKDPGKIKEWYKTHLGLDTTPYGASFEWRQDADPTKKGSTQWSPFAETTKYFDPSTKDFMINYRVENLEALVEQLKREGVTIVDKLEASEYGKFVHIIDLEGNKVELWEPNDTE
jgi:predicted enzyme related to lactoylglutathione lyase